MRRKTSIVTDSGDITLPRPSQVGHLPRSCWPRSLPTRLRVNSSRPSGENDWIVERVRSLRRPSCSAPMTRLRSVSEPMSMKSQTMMPPMSRRRTWRAISLAASTLVRTIVSSRFLPPVNLPELTSMTVSASVDSITIEPPEGSLTVGFISARDLVVDLEVGEEPLAALVVLDAVDVLRPEQAHEVACTSSTSSGASSQTFWTSGVMKSRAVL